MYFDSDDFTLYVAGGVWGGGGASERRGAFCSLNVNFTVTKLPLAFAAAKLAIRGAKAWILLSCSSTHLSLQKCDDFMQLQR